MNKCIFLGRFTKNTETRQAGETTVARNTMAIDNGKNKPAEFINLVAFDKIAEFMEKYGNKGKRFLVDTHVKNGSYEKDGVKRYTTDFIIDRIEFADGAGEPTQTNTNNDFMDIPAGLDEELPFN